MKPLNILKFSITNKFYKYRFYIKLGTRECPLKKYFTVPILTSVLCDTDQL